MPTRVMIPPDPLLTPADIPGSHAADDPTVTAMIAAATARIDGPNGWLGRSFGPQTLQLAVKCWGDLCKLPYGPVIDVDSIIYYGSDGSENLVEDTSWVLDGDYLSFVTGFTYPAAGGRHYPIKVQYQTGYDGEDPFSGGTGDVPEEAKAAIIEGVQQLILARNDQLGLRSVETNDIETITYLDADKVSTIMRNASAGLISNLWVPIV